MERIQKLKEYLAAQPGDSFLQHALALEYIKLGNDEEALGLFENLLQSNPQYVGSYYHMAALLLRLGHKEKAIAAYEAGINQAKLAGDSHALNELRMAYDEVVDE